LAAGTHNDSSYAVAVVQYFEFAPAYGASLASFTVTTASGTQTWKGFTFEGATTVTSGNKGDSVFYTVAFSDLNLTQFVIAQMLYDSTGLAGAAAIASTNFFASSGIDTTFTGSASLLSTGATCSQQAGLAAAAVLTTWAGTASNCQLGKFQVSFQATFPAHYGLGALSSISISNTTFNGVRVYQASTASHVAAIPSKLAALGMQLSRLPGWRTTH
jgi:hypothetical protein